MKDQAERLREKIEKIKLKQLEQLELNGHEGHEGNGFQHAKILTVTSGKGGVGKTNVSVNLAIALSQMGQRVIILDVDFGLANIDILFGIFTKYSLVDIIHNDKNILEVLTDGPNGIKFLSGGSGVEDLIRLDKFQLERLIKNISLLDKLYDIILIDTGAGLSENVMSFVMAADEVVLVTTPEPTAITDAYALIKMISNRDKSKEIKVIVNKAEMPKEAEDVFNKISMVSEKFLSLRLTKLGYILNDDNVVRSVKRQEPFYLSYPKCEAAKQIRQIAEHIMDMDGAMQIAGEKGFKGFFNRMLNYWGKE